MDKALEAIDIAAKHRSLDRIGGVAGWNWA
jgi:hypothetical protein